MQPQINIEYHLQEESFYCGAACAQMVLSQNKVGVPHSVNTCQDVRDASGNIVQIYDCTNNTGDCRNNIEVCQRCLYDESNCTLNTDHPEIGWYSYPDALTRTMNNHRPAVFAQNFRFVLFEEDVTTQPQAASIITHRIAWTIHHYGIAPIAMVLTGKHWVVVTGYDAPTDPVSHNDSMFDVNTITQFWIHDPFTPDGSIPAPPPPPHTTNDNCGNWGIPNQVILKSEWFDRYMVPIDAGYWKNKYLTICDPEKGPKKGTDIYKEKTQFAGNKLISPDTVAALAKRFLSENGFTAKDFLPEQLQYTEPSKPILVKSIDRKNDYYYIVPMLGADKRVYGLINIDARFGNVKQAGFAKKDGHLVKYTPFTKKEILEFLINDTAFIKKEKIKIFPKAVSVSPVLVWRPCQESLSPFYPFQVVTIGHTLLYMRTDGKIFTHLSTEGKGM